MNQFATELSAFLDYENMIERASILPIHRAAIVLARYTRSLATYYYREREFTSVLCKLLTKTIISSTLFLFSLQIRL